MPFASKLRHYFQIREADVSASSERLGGLDQTYTILLKLWGSLSPITDNSTAAIIRGVNIDEVATHTIKFRWIDIKSLGNAFTSGFSFGFKSMPELNPLKNQYFIYKEEGSAVKGRLFKILGTRIDEAYKEYVYVKVREIEEHGTGHGEL